MIAYNTIDDQWNLIPGSSPTSFDASKSTVLDLCGEMVNAGGWDDTPLFTRHLESAYLTMYNRYQQGLDPDHIYLEH